MRAALAILAVLAGAPVVSFAEDDDDGALGSGTGTGTGTGGDVLVARGSTWDVAFVTAPRITRRLGAVALGGVDVAAGRREHGVAVHGDDAAAAPPAAWPLANHAGAKAVVTPLGHGESEQDCKCETRFADLGAVGEADRVAVMWATRRFAVEHDVTVLDVAARYGDGIAVWINGVEVARRRLDPTARPAEMAEIIHGPEWETFHVPVSPGLLRAGDNVIAVELRPSGRSTAPRFDLELIGRDAARLTRGPMLLNVGATSASNVIESDLPLDAAIEWGETDALGQRVASGAGRARRHVVDLAGLPASSTVHYRVIAGGAASPTRTFRTLPAAGEVVRLGLYGDVRGGHATHARLLAQLRAEDPDAIVATGDLVLRGSDEADWQRFFEVTGEVLATIPYVSAIGNHDTGRTGDARRRFGTTFALPPAAGDTERPEWAHWYGFDIGSVHLAMLDSNAYDDERQLEWLDADLTAARARGARVLIAVTHDGPFSRGTHGGNARAAKDFVPVLAKHGVTLILSGHDHIYQRGRQGDVDYIVSGGGGAPLYSITCGVSGKRACKVDDGMIAVAKEHHYVMLAVYPDVVEVCPKRQDGTPLEACVKIKVPKN
jgi:hypothetical protein